MVHVSAQRCEPLEPLGPWSVRVVSDYNTMSSIKDICIVVRDRLLLDQQSAEGAAAVWEALKTELTYATGLQQAMDTTVV